MTELTWGELIAGATLVEQKVCAAQCRTLDVIAPDVALPSEWTFEVRGFGRERDEFFDVRVRASANGPSGDVLVEGFASFQFDRSTEGIDQSLLNRFFTMVAIPSAVPTARATYADLCQRMNLLDAPPFGLVRVTADGKVTVSNGSLAITDPCALEAENPAPGLAMEVPLQATSLVEGNGANPPQDT